MTLNDEDLWQHVFDFFISGKAILILFLYLLFNFLLYDFLSIIIPSLLFYYTKGSKDLSEMFTSGFLRGNLLLFRVIQIDKVSKKTVTGPNFEAFCNELNILENEDFKAELRYVPHSFLFEIVSTYFIFIIVFYFFTDIELPIILDAALLFGFVFFAIIYIYMSKLIDYFVKNGNKILLALYVMKSEEIVGKLLTDFNIPFTRFRGLMRDSFAKEFAINGQKYLLQFYGNTVDLPERLIDECIKFNAKESNAKIILVSKNKLTNKASTLINENQEIFSLIEFSTDMELIQKLEENIYERLT